MRTALANAGCGAEVDVVSGGRTVVDVAGAAWRTVVTGAVGAVEGGTPGAARDDGWPDPHAATATVAAKAAADALVVIRRGPSVALNPMVDKRRKPADRSAVAVTLAALVVASLLGGCSSRSGRDAVRAAAPSEPRPGPTLGRRAPAPATSASRPVVTTTRRAKVVRGAATAPTPATAGPAPVTTAPCPAGLASELSRTGGARQLVIVSTAGYGTSVATVELWQWSGRCWASVGGPWSGWVGENGFSDHKREGDGTTPTGMYGFGPVIYGNAPDPGAHGAYHRLVCGDWWDEDPSSAAYNTFQHVPCGATPPFGGDSEALWTETTAYPSFAVVDYNNAPVVRGAGSAIFVHADLGHATTGCVSIPRPDLDQLLRWLQPSETPAIVMGSASEITRF